MTLLGMLFVGAVQVTALGIPRVAFLSFIVFVPVQAAPVLDTDHAEVPLNVPAVAWIKPELKLLAKDRVTAPPEVKVEAEAVARVPVDSAAPMT